METRRRSKKLRDLGAPVSLANSRPTSGIAVVRQRNANPETDGLANVTVEIPGQGIGHRSNSGTQNTLGPAAAGQTEGLDTSHPEDLPLTPSPSALPGKVRIRPKKEDFVFKMLEDGTVDGVLNVIGQMAQMYLKCVPPDRVLDELAKAINEEQGTQQDITAKMAALEAEAANLEKTIVQLQRNHGELTQMGDTRAKSATERNPDQLDAKHALEDKLKKAKAMKSEKTKRK